MVSERFKRKNTLNCSGTSPANPRVRWLLLTSNKDGDNSSPFTPSIFNVLSSKLNDEWIGKSITTDFSWTSAASTTNSWV